MSEWVLKGSEGNVSVVPAFMAFKRVCILVKASDCMTDRLLAQQAFLSILARLDALL